VKTRFELIYSYKHCRKESVYSAGFVDSEEEAAAWARAKNEEKNEPVSNPQNDLVCTCEVSFCPMKFQRPWHSYRAV